MKRELVSELELLLSLVPVELVPNLLLLNLITLKTSTLSDSSKFESWLRASGSSSRPTGVTREGLPKPGGSYGFTTAEKNDIILLTMENKKQDRLKKKIKCKVVKMCHGYNGKGKAVEGLGTI